MWNIDEDDEGNGRWSKGTVREMLSMTQCQPLPDTNSQAMRVRNTISEIFWKQKNE